MAHELEYTAHGVRTGLNELERRMDACGDHRVGKVSRLAEQLLQLLAHIPPPPHLAVPEKPVNLSAEASRLSVLPADRRLLSHISPAAAMGWGGNDGGATFYESGTVA